MKVEFASINIRKNKESIKLLKSQNVVEEDKVIESKFDMTNNFNNSNNFCINDMFGKVYKDDMEIL